MRRWFLLALGGFGASAAAVVLLPGTAHALAPARAGSVAVPIVAPAPQLPVPTPPAAVLPPLPPVAIPPVPLVATAKKVVTGVVDRVRIQPVIVVEAPVTLPSAVVAVRHAATRAPSTVVALAPRRNRPDRAPRLAAAFPDREAAHAAMTATRPSQTPRPGASLAGLLLASTDNAVTPAKPTLSTPFACTDTPTLKIAVTSARVPPLTGDRTRPGFLVGSARPG